MGMAAGKDREMFHEKNLLQPFNPSFKNLSPQSKARKRKTKKERKREKRKEGRRKKDKDHPPFSYRIELESFTNLMNGRTTEPFLKQKIYCLYSTSPNFTTLNTLMYEFFYSCVQKIYLFLYIGKKVGWGKGAASTHASSSCLNFHFPKENSGFLSQLSWSRFHFRQTTSQLSRLGSTLGRQNSCCVGLPGRQLRGN